MGPYRQFFAGDVPWREKFDRTSDLYGELSYGISGICMRIAQRFRPFSHRPGTAVVIPFTFWQVQVFPTLLKFRHLETQEEREEQLPWEGPVKGFTVELDLEKGLVWVYGETADGYRRHPIRRPQGVGTLPMERLSLGMNKTLDWELVSRRKDLREIFPLWLRLGQMVPEVAGSGGVLRMVHPYDKLEVVEEYLKIFMAGFSGILVPRLRDLDHQGIVPPRFEEELSGSSLALLTEGARQIRALFFANHSFLPCLPPAFHAGRLIHLQTEEMDRIDMEWSKKMLRKVMIIPGQSRSAHWIFPKPLRSYRLRFSVQEKGVRVGVEEALEMKSGHTLYLDRFEK